jgi:hypothetical protein
MEEEVVNETTRIPSTHLPIKAAQLDCAEAVKKKKEYHQAFKCATVFYDREQQKPDGMSSKTVVDLIKNESGVQLS